MSETNRQWLLAKRPAGMVDESSFRLHQEPAPEAVEDGDVVVRNLMLSCDPTQRGWISRDTYLPAVKIGEVMRSGAGGRVVASRNPDFAVGDSVTGMLGWQDYALVKSRASGSRLMKLPPGVPLELAMGVMGLTGITAYFGLLEVGRPKAGDTVLVSGAAGATGSVVGQIARIKGCRAIGLAGGKDKCDWLVKEARFDAAIDYKSEDVAARVKEACPRGVDVYFDNVGGETLDTALAQLAMGGRVVLCGAIATYNDADLRPGPKHYLNLLLKRGRMRGFSGARLPAARPRSRDAALDLGARGADCPPGGRGRGARERPRALMRLFTGDNQGKQLVRIAP